MVSQLLDAFSGPASIFMYSITAVLAYTLAVIIERLFLFLTVTTPSDEVLKGLIDPQKHAQVLVELNAHPAHEILSAGQAANNAEQAWNAMTAKATIVEGRIRKRIASLATAGNIATMLGLLGTVYGLIFALDGLDQASAIERTAQLSQGIAAAMITTAYGLIVGVPALVAHRSLASKADEILRFCEAVAATVASTKE
ncbi:MAG: MotA/TolQ/ExbB proton channel family protein [Myxococcota bacterium]